MGVMGFCWGVIGVILTAQDPQFKFGITFHPSFGLVPHVGLDNFEEISKVVVPQQYMYTLQEDKFCWKGGELYNLYQKVLGDKFEGLDYSDQNHGFMTRGSFSIPGLEKRYKESLNDALRFMKKYFS